MNKLDELLGAKLASKLSEALGLADSDEADVVLKQMHDQETELLMTALKESSGNAPIVDVYRFALVSALSKHIIERRNLDQQMVELSTDLSELREDAWNTANKKDALEYEVVELRAYKGRLEPLQALVNKLVVYIAATPGTLDAFLPDVATEVDEYLSGRKVGQIHAKLEAIKFIRQVLQCGLKEAKDLVEARMVMNATDEADVQALAAQLKGNTFASDI